MNQTRKKAGFTLLEMLLVIAIIAILAGIVIVAINPAKQLGDANNAQRHSDVLAILNAIHQYSIDNSGDLSELLIPTLATASDACEDEDPETGDGAICKFGETCGGVDFDDLVGDGDTLPSYLTDIPIDPAFTDVADLVTGYLVYQDTSTNRITVCAPSTENTDYGQEIISVTR